MNIIIKGQELEAKEGQTVLQVARENGIYIPTALLSCQDRSGREMPCLCG